MTSIRTDCDKLYCLIYTSTAANNLNQPSLFDLAQKSAKKNIKINITGILLYHDMSFMQVLEGPEREVLSLYETIKADKRHYGIITLYGEPIATRNFSGWGMALADPDAFNQKGADLFEALVKAGPDQSLRNANSHRITRLISTFRDIVGIRPAALI